MMSDDLPEPPCSTPSPSTGGLPAPYPPPPPSPLKSLSLGDLTDLVIAFAMGEMSEGFLIEITGLSGDQVRALHYDAVQRANQLADAWLSARSVRADPTRGQPGSSPKGGSAPGSSGPGPTG